MEHKSAGRIHPASAEGGCRDLGTILIVAAVPQELRDFRVDGWRQVSCLVTGMGRQAGEVVRRRLSFGDVSLVVSTGFAGGTRPGFKVGDLVMASEVIQASSGDRSQPVSSYFSLSDKAQVGPFVTVDRALPDPKAKAWAGNRFGAIAADMESAAVVQAAGQAGVAWVAMRAILDPLESPLVIRSRAQALRMLAVPRRWKEFFNFMQSVETAGRSLAEGLNLLISRAVIPAQAGIRSSLSRG